jgi:hypothetical protein
MNCKNTLRCDISLLAVGALTPPSHMEGNSSVNRRLLLTCAKVLSTATRGLSLGQNPETAAKHSLPDFDHDRIRAKPYIEQAQALEYRWSSEHAVEAFRDLRFGLHTHFEICSIIDPGNGSWQYLPKTSYGGRRYYPLLYKSWNPPEFDANSWMSLCNEAGGADVCDRYRQPDGFAVLDTQMQAPPTGEQHPRRNIR